MNNSIHTIYFPAAFALGALHAMEPGHAKALTASYLIGIKGTKRDSVILGLSVATTHSLVVILISSIGLWIGNEAFAGRATKGLEMASGLVAVAIGSWMLWRRLSIGKKKHLLESFEFVKAAGAARKDKFSIRVKKSALHHNHDHHGHHFHGHSHDHLDDVAHAKAHAATLPDYALKGEKPRLGQIILFGAAGGMIPCPASITVMLLALSTGKAGMGILTVIGFSLGLAVALVGIGVIVVTGLSQLSETGRLSWITRRAPVLSAGLVILSGLSALFFVHKG